MGVIGGVLVVEVGRLKLVVGRAVVVQVEAWYTSSEGHELFAIAKPVRR